MSYFYSVQDINDNCEYHINLEQICQYFEERESATIWLSNGLQHKIAEAEMERIKIVLQKIQLQQFGS